MSDGCVGLPNKLIPRHQLKSGSDNSKWLKVVGKHLQMVVPGSVPGSGFDKWVKALYTHKGMYWYVTGFDQTNDVLSGYLLNCYKLELTVFSDTLANLRSAPAGFNKANYHWNYQHARLPDCLARSGLGCDSKGNVFKLN